MKVFSATVSDFYMEKVDAMVYGVPTGTLVTWRGVRKDGSTYRKTVLIDKGMRQIDEKGNMYIADYNVDENGNDKYNIIVVTDIKEIKTEMK